MGGGGKALRPPKCVGQGCFEIWWPKMKCGNDNTLLINVGCGDRTDQRFCRTFLGAGGGRGGGGAGGHRVREEEEAEAEGAWDPRERISACGGTSG